MYEEKRMLKQDDRSSSNIAEVEHTQVGMLDYVFAIHLIPAFAACVVCFCVDFGMPDVPEGQTRRDPKTQQTWWNPNWL